MQNDVGVVTNDNDDQAPPSRLDAFNAIHSPPVRNKRAKTLHKLDDFDTDLGVNQETRKDKDSWWGVILDIDTTTVIGNRTYYEVQLQTGEFVQAYFSDQTVATNWNDNQKVHVIFDGTDYVIMTTPTASNTGILWEAIATLYPGGSANGKLLSYNKDTQLYEDLKSTVTISDNMKRNFVLRGERIQVALNDLSYEPIGSNGISHRKAKSTVRIDAGQSGMVTVYFKGIAAQEPKAHPNESSDQTVSVSASLNWAAGTKPVQPSKELFISYYTEEETWVIVGGEC